MTPLRAILLLLLAPGLDLRRFGAIDDLDRCHILFVGEHDETRVHAILRRVRDQPTLIVGETKGFIAAGGDVQFVVRDDRIRFRVDDERARLAGLDISAKLLQLSE